MKDHLREKQTEGLEEAFPMEREEETEEDYILRHLQKGMRETSRRKNGQYLQVWEEEMEKSLRMGITAEDPPTPALSEDRFFTDWSSLGSGSPPVRMLPQSVPVGMRPDNNQFVNQTTQSGSEPIQLGVMENTLQEDTIVFTPRTQ